MSSKNKNVNNRKDPKNLKKGKYTVKKSDFIDKEQFNNAEEPLPDSVVRSIKARQRKIMSPINIETVRELEDEDDISEDEENVLQEEEIKPAYPAANKKIITLKRSAPVKPDSEEKKNVEESESDKDRAKENTVGESKKTREIQPKEDKTPEKKPSGNKQSSQGKKTKKLQEPAKNGKNRPKSAVNNAKKRPANKSGKSKKKKNPEDDIINITDIRKARKKEKRKKRIKSYIVAGIVAVFGISVYMTRGLWVPKLEGILDQPHDTIVNNGETKAGNFPIEVDGDSDASLCDFGDYLIIIDKNHILMYDENGEEAGSFNHYYAAPAVCTAKKRVLVYDVGGNSFQVLTRKKEVYSKTLDKPVLMARIANNGNVVAVTQSEEYECKVTVFDTNGNEIFRWDCGKILNIRVNESGNGCCVSTFSSSGGDIYSVIYKLDFGSDQPVMKSAALDTLALDVCETDDKGIWVAGDDKFFKLDSDGNIKLSYEYPGEPEGYAIGAKGAAVVCKGVSRNKSTISFFKSGTDDTAPCQILKTDNGNAKKFKYVDGMLVMLKDDILESYDISGNLLATAKVSADYKDFVIINQNAYFMSKNAINKIEFKTD